jgi:hypothetical protein
MNGCFRRSRDQWISGLCAKCGQPPTENGHDPCIANFPGVIYACCGHGNPDKTYFKFAFGPTVRGSHAAVLMWMKVVGTNCHGGCPGPGVAEAMR